MATSRLWHALCCALSQQCNVTHSALIQPHCSIPKCHVLVISDIKIALYWFECVAYFNRKVPTYWMKFGKSTVTWWHLPVFHRCDIWNWKNGGPAIAKSLHHGHFGIKWSFINLSGSNVLRLCCNQHNEWIKLRRIQWCHRSWCA